jgi:uncharacterized OB-fold protein
VQEGIDDFAGHDLKTASPLSTYQAHCRAGRLAYQVDSDGRAVFHPRVAAPGSGAPLSWRISAGLGTVYSTTVVHPREGSPYNVALIDLDEGFRMMSRVEGIAPTAVAIGLRVQVRMVDEEDGIARPVFVAAEAP